MVSEKKLAANRQNTQLSTGPKDTSITRYNATRHGVFSSAEVIEAVDGKGAQDIYAELLAKTWLELAPVGIIEEEYAMQLVDIIWRRRRLMRWQTATIQAELAHYDSSINKRAQHSLPSPAPLVLLDDGEGESSPEQHGPQPTADAEGQATNLQDRELERPRAGLLSDLHLTTFLRYDAYLIQQIG